MARQRKTKKIQRLNFNEGIAYIRATCNNTIVSITDKNSVHPTIYPEFKAKQVYYWSSSAVVKPSEKANAWGVLFRYGYNRWNNKKEKNYARCVRN